MTFNTVLDNLNIYEAGKPIELVVREYGIDPKDIIKLASNENPYGTSPKVVEAIEKKSSSSFVYPDDSMYELKEALAKRFNVADKNVIIGAGSDQIIEFCVHAKCSKDSKVLMAKTTFAMYEIYSKQTGATILKTPSDKHDLDEFRKIYKEEGADIIFLCLPNNPMGECLDAKEVYSFLDEVDKDTLVVLDEDVRGGASAFLLQHILEDQKGYQYLDGAPVTITSKDHRPAFASDGDYFSKPSHDDIVEQLYAVMHEKNPELYPSI